MLQNNPNGSSSSSNALVKPSGLQSQMTIKNTQMTSQQNIATTGDGMGGGSYDGGLNAIPTVKSLAATSANSGQTIGPMLSHSTK